MLTITRRAVARLLLATALAGATLPMAACEKNSAAASGPAVTAENYPESEAGLTKLFADLMAAVKAKNEKRFAEIADSLTLPDPKAWFAATFGADAADRLTTEYSSSPVPGFNKAMPALADLLADGRTEITVGGHADSGDEDATGYQVTALEAMTKPTALYTVRMARPSGDKGFTLWSFAWVDGQFRMVGKMKSVDPEPRSSDLDMLSELSMKSAREILGQ